ncbi:MAG: dCMP deaminase family protein [Succinivibrionaceae bacterium]|nr:dCMP deaminase family protein [Succinivibrionaceae bacterium]
MGTSANIEFKLHDGSTRLFLSKPGCPGETGFRLSSADFWKRSSSGTVEAPDEKAVFDYIAENLHISKISEKDTGCDYDYYIDLTDFAKCTFSPLPKSGEPVKTYPLTALCACSDGKCNDDVAGMIRELSDSSRACGCGQKHHPDSDIPARSSCTSGSTGKDYSSNIKWAVRYFEIAELVSSWSKDPSTKVGAIIVGDKGQIIAQGYNGFPRGVEDLEERYNHRETKYKFVVHAEMNAILNALYNGSSVAGASIYIHNLPVCQECAKAIIQSGISKVFIDTEIEGKWLDAWQFSKVMLREAGVQVFMLSEDKTRLIHLD